MCKGGGRFVDYTLFGNRGAFAQIGYLGQNIFRQVGIDTGTKTEDYYNSAWGIPTAEERLDREQDKLNAMAQKAALAQRENAMPTPGATFINPASEIANRRRKALLDARRSPLTPQSGLGANAPLY